MSKMGKKHNPMMAILDNQLPSATTTKIGQSGRTGIDVCKGVLGGLTPPPLLRLKIWADPPSWKIFE